VVSRRTHKPDFKVKKGMKGNGNPGRAFRIPIQMVRPCFLVIDREFPGSISTRKLVLETAKYNVITAYSAREAIDTLRLFPCVSGIILDKSIRDMPCADLVREIRSFDSSKPIVLIAGPSSEACDDADYILEFYTPEALLELIRNICPADASAIAAHTLELEKQQ
jgi:CheY-like chemotaxis protein